MRFVVIKATEPQGGYRPCEDAVYDPKDGLYHISFNSLEELVHFQRHRIGSPIQIEYLDEYGTITEPVITLRNDLLRSY